MEETPQTNEFHRSIEAMSSMLPDQQRMEAILILAKDTESPELLLDAILNVMNGNEMFQKRFDLLGVDKKIDVISRFLKSFKSLGADVHHMIVSPKFQQSLADYQEQQRSSIMLSQTLSSVLIVDETDKDIDIEACLVGNKVRSTLTITNNSQKDIVFKMAMCFKKNFAKLEEYSEIKGMRSPLLLSLHNEEAKMLKPVKLEKKGLFANAYLSMKSSPSDLVKALDAFHKTRSHKALINNDPWVILLDNFTIDSKEFTDHTVVKSLDTFSLDVNGFKSMGESQFFLLIEAQTLPDYTDMSEEVAKEILNKEKSKKDNVIVE